MKKCFYCKIEKPLEAYQINNRKYQVKADKGRCISCKQCFMEQSIKDLSVIYFNFDIGKYEIVKFETKKEVKKFIENI